jgi:predicted GNAT family acetyltransferase
MRLRAIAETIETSPQTGITPARCTVELERRFRGEDYDAAPGEVRTYRVALRDQSNKIISSTSLMVHDAEPSIGRISDLKTDPDYRKMGYATRLYNELSLKARKLGLSELYSDTSQAPATRRIWQKLGAQKFRAPEGEVYRLEL